MAETYIRDVLQDHVASCAPYIEANFVLMQDLLNHVQIPTMNRPACSSDMNHIERAWNMLDRQRCPEHRKHKSCSEVNIGKFALKNDEQSHHKYGNMNNYSHKGSCEEHTSLE